MRKNGIVSPSRRAVLTGALGLTTLAALPGCGGSGAGGAGRGGRVGLQLYTVREAMAQDTEGTVRRIAEMGDDELEFAGYHQMTPRGVRELVADLGISAPSGHANWQALRDDPQAQIDAAAEAGHQNIVLAWLPEEERASKDDWYRWAERCNEFGTMAREAGLRFAYHNHDFEFAPVGNTVPYDILLTATEPDLVDIELDLYWVRAAGLDIADVVARSPERIRMLHVKDMAESGEMADVGAGTIDFASVFGMPGLSVAHYFAERDDASDPFASAEASEAALRRLLA